MYVCQSVAARAELQELMHCKNHLIVGGNGMVQDSSLGIYLLTMEDRDLGKSLFFDCIMWIQHPYFDKQPYDPPYTSRRLISYLMPPWLNVEGLVKDGIVIGTLNKKRVKKQILPLLHADDGALALLFLSSLQRLSAEYFRRRGFSVGISSLLPDTAVDLQVDIPDKLSDWEMACVVQRLKNEKAADAKKLFLKSNPFLQLTSEGSGAKGSLMNIIQMKTSLGPQYVNGSMIKKYRKSSYGNRVLSSDPFGALSNTIFTKGYIQGAFLEGLTPQQMFLHAISSRINLLDTALKTANSGYMSRKIWKCLEDSLVHHPTWKGGDMTVRCDGKMIHFGIEKDSLKHRTLEPGFPIGIILSQSIGQQIMQLTLNTFHNVGSGNSVVEGIPRMEALINCWRKKLVQQTMITMPMSTYNIHKHILKHDYLCIGKLLHSTDVRRGKLVLTFENITCVRSRVHPWHLEEAFNTSTLYPVFKATCKQKMSIIELTISNSYGWDDNDALLKMVKQLAIRGNQSDFHVYDGQETLQLTGTTLSQEFEKMNPYSLKLSSNNMLEVAKVLGIEAAKDILFRELCKVFNNGVDKTYLSILCGWMTWLGEVCPTTRIGMGKFYGEENAFKGMSFERTLRTASNAATKEIKTKFEGLSERIIVNKLIKHGSGFCDVIKAPAECGHEDCWKGHCRHEHFEKKRQRNMFEAEEPWMMDTSNATYDPFVGGGAFNANPYGTMGGMMPINANPYGGMGGMMPLPPSIMAPQVQESITQPSEVSYDHLLTPPASPTYDPFRPNSPKGDRPPSPSYAFSKPPSPPLSPSYDPFAPDIEDVEWHPS